MNSDNHEACTEALQKYGDIIDHPYSGTATRPHLSMAGRAAQFAPFAALSGHEKAISDTAAAVNELYQTSNNDYELFSKID